MLEIEILARQICKKIENDSSSNANIGCMIMMVITAVKRSCMEYTLADAVEAM